MTTPTPTPLRPDSTAAVQTHVQEALAAGTALEVLGHGSKRGYGRAVAAQQSLSTAALRGVVDYQPHELILVARPGTPLAELEQTLAEAGQAFAFEPPHWSAEATLGGAIACNLAGPRRFKAGAARDHLLGFEAVSGTGEIIRGGGRVVKNVTGYDLPKLMCGSFGTLAVLTELVVKVLPRAETERTVLLPGLEDAAGIAQLIAVSRTHDEPSGLAHLPAGLPLPPAVAAAANGDAAGGALTAVRLEGPEPSVVRRCEKISAGQAGATVLAEAESRALWEAVRELTVLPLEPHEHLWRFSVPPTGGAPLGRQLLAVGATRLCYDWGGALVWATVPHTQDAAALHAQAREAGGTAHLVRRGAAADLPEAVFSPLPAGQHRLNLNLKQAFDPGRILNPGRMYPDL